MFSFKILRTAWRRASSVDSPTTFDRELQRQPEAARSGLRSEGRGPKPEAESRKLKACLQTFVTCYPRPDD